jgi:predicted glutamine amidotransferase
MVVEDGNTSSKEEDGKVAIIATQPLTNDESSWVELMRGDLLLFCNGQVFTSHTDLSR